LPFEYDGRPLADRPPRFYGTVFGIFGRHRFGSASSRKISRAIAIGAIQVAQGEFPIPQKFERRFKTPWGFIAVADLPAQLFDFVHGPGGVRLWAILAAKTCGGVGRTTTSLAGPMFGFRLASWGACSGSARHLRPQPPPYFGRFGAGRLRQDCTIGSPGPSGLHWCSSFRCCQLYLKEIFFRGLHAADGLWLRWSPWVGAGHWGRDSRGRSMGNGSVGELPWDARPLWFDCWPGRDGSLGPGHYFLFTDHHRIGQWRFRVGKRKNWAYGREDELPAP